MEHDQTAMLQKDQIQPGRESKMYAIATKNVHIYVNPVVKVCSIDFSKTIAPIVFKFHIKVKFSQVENPRWLPLLKMAKTTKSASVPEPLCIFG